MQHMCCAGTKGYSHYIGVYVVACKVHGGEQRGRFEGVPLPSKGRFDEHDPGLLRKRIHLVARDVARAGAQLTVQSSTVLVENDVVRRASQL